MSDPIEQYGGVLAAPPRRPWRLAIILAGALAGTLLAATAIVIVATWPSGPSRPSGSRPSGLAATLSGNHAAVSAAFSPDGRTLAVLESNGSTQLWDLVTRRFTGTLTSPQCGGDPAQVGYPVQVLFSPDGKTLAVITAANGGYACLWDVTVRHQIATMTEPGSILNEDSFSGGAFSPDGTMLAIGDPNGSTYLWDVATGRQVATLTVPGDNTIDNAVDSVAFSPDGTLAVGDDDGNLYLWDVATRQLTAVLSDQNAPSGPGAGNNGNGVESLSFGPDGTLAVGVASGDAFLWNISTRQATRDLNPPINMQEAAPPINSPSQFAGIINAGNAIGVKVVYSQNGAVLAAGILCGYGVYEGYSGCPVEMQTNYR